MEGDEIKEIINYFKDDINFLEEEFKRTNFLGRYITLQDKECNYLKKLLDYITNLQQELKNKNEGIKAFCEDLKETTKQVGELESKNKQLQQEIENKSNVINDLLSRIVGLERENERLETNSGELQNAIDNIAELLDVPEGMSIEDVYDKVKDYKSRVEKAIEYIKSYNLPEDLGHFGEAPISIRELKDLLELLQGCKDDSNLPTN